MVMKSKKSRVHKGRAWPAGAGPPDEANCADWLAGPARVFLAGLSPTLAEKDLHVSSPHEMARCYEHDVARLPKPEFYFLGPRSRLLLALVRCA